MRKESQQWAGHDVGDLIRKRAIPGVLVFDAQNRLVYANEEASSVLSGLRDIPESLLALAGRELKRQAEGLPRDGDDFEVLTCKGGGLYALRTVRLKGAEQGIPAQVMVLIEKVGNKRSLDLDRARERFQISPREMEVLALVCEGLSNRKIAESLYISEQTVKDHVRSLMKKVGASSRSALIAALQ